MSSSFSRAAASAPFPCEQATKNAAELVPEHAERVEVGPRDAVVQVLPVGHERAQPVHGREQVAALVPEAGGVHEPDGELGIG